MDDVPADVDADAPPMVLGAASAESVCPVMALEEQTVLGPSQTTAALRPELMQPMRAG